MSKLARFAFLSFTASIASLLVSSSLFANETEAPAAEVAEGPSEQLLFAIILKPGRNWKRGQDFSKQGLGPHFSYLKSLVDQGHILSAGPLGNDQGLILLYAENQESADNVLNNDPAIIQGTFVGEAKPYVVRLRGSAPLELFKK